MRLNTGALPERGSDEWKWEEVRTCLVGERGSMGMAKLSPACKLGPLLISAHTSIHQSDCPTQDSFHIINSTAGNCKPSPKQLRWQLVVQPVVQRYAVRGLCMACMVCWFTHLLEHPTWQHCGVRSPKSPSCSLNEWTGEAPASHA